MNRLRSIPAPLGLFVVRFRRVLAMAAIAMMFAGGVAGCIVAREAEEESDAVEEEAPPTVPPFGQPVRVVAMYPPEGATNVPLNAVVWVQFDQYLDLEPLQLTRSLRLRSNGVNASVALQYEMSRRRIVGRVRRPLEPGLIYELSVDATRINAIDGSPMLESPEISFATAPVGVVVEEVTSATEWEDVAAVFDEGCGCHRLAVFPEPWFELPALTYERIVGQPSLHRPDAKLVEPFRPAESVLMHKILVDYPEREGTSMPPVWAPHDERTRSLPSRPLTTEEIARIEDWIQLGAQR